MTESIINPYKTEEPVMPNTSAHTLRRATAILAVNILLFLVLLIGLDLVLRWHIPKADFFERTYPISMAFAATFVFGILFGMLCMTAFVVRLINERRSLRRSLRVSESEVSSLRNLPLSDAD